MIRVIGDLPANVVGFEATDEVSADEYREQVEPLLEAAAAGAGKARVLAVLGPQFHGFAGGAMLEDASLGLRTWSSWERIAIVSDDHRIRSSIRLLGWLVPGDIAVYGMDQLAEARAWVSEPGVSPS